MGIFRQRFATPGTSLLCVLLVLNPIIWNGGCTNTGIPLADGWVRAALPSSHPLTSTLAAQGFAGASAIDLHPASGQYRVVFGDSVHRVEGAFGSSPSARRVSTMEIGSGPLAVKIEVDAQLRITGISTSTGLVWAPEKGSLDGLPSPPPEGVDGFMRANQELISLARQLDESLGGGATPAVPGNSGGSGGGAAVGISKGIQASQDIGGQLSSILGTLGMIIGIQAAIVHLPALLVAFQIMTALNLTPGLFGSNATTTPTADTSNQAVITGDATLLVVNNMPGGEPIWYVVLIENKFQRLAGGNLLGDESIPNGQSRAFAVPPGNRKMNIIIPHGHECYSIYHVDVVFSSNSTFEINLDGSETPEIYPEGCTGS